MKRAFSVLVLSLLLAFAFATVGCQQKPKEEAPKPEMTQPAPEQQPAAPAAPAEQPAAPAPAEPEKK